MGWGGSNIVLGESQSRFYPHMRAKFGRGPTAVSKEVSFNFISLLILYKRAQAKNNNFSYLRFSPTELPIQAI